MCIENVYIIRKWKANGSDFAGEKNNKGNS